MRKTERVGFEPTLTQWAKLVFETSAFSRSATSPEPDPSWIHAPTLMKAETKHRFGIVIEFCRV